MGMGRNQKKLVTPLVTKQLAKLLLRAITESNIAPIFYYYTK